MAKGKKKEKAKKKSKKKGSGDSAVQQFLIANGEKIGLGVVGLVVILCLVAAISKESVSEGLYPDKLLGVAQAKRNAWIAYEPEGIPSSEFMAILDAKKTLDAKQFSPLDKMATPPPVPLHGKRNEPAYLPPESLQVVPGHGYLALAGSAEPGEGNSGEDEPGYEAVPGNLSRAKHYMVITGLVPHKKQRGAFQGAFADTLGGKEGVDPFAVEYYRMIVERAEVKAGQTEDQLAWRIINEKSTKGLTDDVRDRALDKLIMEVWADILPDSIEHLPEEFVEYAMVYVNTFKDEELNFWLPPLMLRNWDPKETVHEKVREVVEKALASPSSSPNDGRLGGRNRDDDDAAVVVDENALAAAADKFGYRMLRHFDFGILPGRQYRYRVRMVVNNPNKDFEERFLNEAAIKARAAAMKANGDDKFRTTPNSVASAAVTVPVDLKLHVGAVMEKTRAGEPSIDIRITDLGEVIASLRQAKKVLDRWTNRRDRERETERLRGLLKDWKDVDFVWATGSFNVYRGQWLNLFGPVGADNGETQATNPLTRTRLALPGFPFQTGHLLVDIRGGGLLTDKRQAAFTVPGEGLLLDPEGRLVIFHEVQEDGGKSFGGDSALPDDRDTESDEDLLDDL